MPYSRHVDSDGILITTLSKIVTLKEVRELEKELCSYLHDHDVYELVLHSQDNEMVLKSSETRTLAYILNESREGPEKHTLAFVCDKDFTFGLCRQLVLQLENTFIQAAAFRTEEAARIWIHEMRSSRAQEPEILL